MVKGYVEPNDLRYQEWIDTNTDDNVKQWCLTKAGDMAKEFPELRVVGVHWFDWGHAWCINEKNEVVDPTAHQFKMVDGIPQFNYNCNKLEHADFPLGKCHWCGEVRWKDTPGVRAYLKTSGDPDSIIGEHIYCNEAFAEEMEREEVIL